MEQSIVNWILAGCSALIGFLLNSIWQAVKDLQTADTKLAEKVSQIEVLVAGDYLRKDEQNAVNREIFSKLDKILDKLDKKADK